MNPDGDVAALREKYEEMLRLRLLHVRAVEDRSFVEPDPRSAMQELARRFPGALRALDRLPLAEIRTRLEALSAMSTPLPWMSAESAFHRLARGALLIKTWLGKRRDVDRPLFESASLGPEAALWAENLRSIAAPPRGRLMGVVLSRAAHEAQMSERALRIQLFGAETRNVGEPL